MNWDWKYILGGAALLGGGAVLVHKMTRLSKELETVTRASIFQVNLLGIQLRIDVTLKNPTGTGLKIKFPFVKILFNDKDANGKDVLKTLAVSQVKDENISIPKFGEVNLEPIMVTLNFLTLATTCPAALNQWRQTNEIELVTKTVTTISPNIPYTKSDKVKIGKG